jgi:hypothetical protein
VIRHICPDQEGGAVFLLCFRRQSKRDERPTVAEPHEFRDEFRLHGVSDPRPDLIVGLVFDVQFDGEGLARLEVDYFRHGLYLQRRRGGKFDENLDSHVLF